MKLFAISVAMRVFSWVTPRAAEYVAPVLATMIWYLVPRLRRTTRINLRAVYPDLTHEQRKKIGRASMTHYAMGILEAGMLWHWPVERVLGHFDQEHGFNLLEEAFALERGVIIAVPHSGAWEMLNLYLNSKGGATVLYKPTKFPELDAMLLEKRRRGGAEMVPATAGGIKKMFNLLKNGSIVALLPDQEPTGGSGEFAPFFGIEALTGVLLSRMARRTGAPIIFAVCNRIKGGRYSVHIFKPDDSIYSQDMREALTAVNQGIEQCIGVDTEQYLWAYKRFRHRPDGEKSIYSRQVP